MLTVFAIFLTLGTSFFIMKFIDRVPFWIVVLSSTTKKWQKNDARHVGLKNLESIERLGTIHALRNNETDTSTTNIKTVQHVCYDSSRHV